MTAQEMAAIRWSKPGARDKQRLRIALVNQLRGLGKGSRPNPKPRKVAP